jgi:hypothetical protein
LHLSRLASSAASDRIVVIVPIGQAAGEAFHVAFRPRPLLSGNVSADNSVDLNFFEAA